MIRDLSTLIFSSSVLLSGLLVGQTQASSPPRPNIVFVLADDLGIGDVRCYGEDRCQIDTPGFDRLAKEGMLFTDAHTAASVCVPARVAIMTGRYPWRFTVPRPSGPWGFLNPRLKSDQFTIGRMLQSAGYRTGYVGKWHLGTLMPTLDGKNQGPDNVDYSKLLTIGPQQYGLDESFVLPGSLDMFPYAFARNNVWQGNVTAQKGWSAFNRVGPAAEDFEDYKVLDTFSTEAEGFISRQAADARNGKPFFLYVALTAPHTPTSPSAKFEGKSLLGIYGDFVMETDDCLHRVLKALDKHGLAESTLVIASSDHGPALYAGRRREATANQLRELEGDGHYSSGIYRGYKFSIYEGGLRVPFVARWPGVVKAGSRCRQLVAQQDLLRTFAEICGANLTNDQAPDSVSFLPLLKSTDGPGRESMILQSTERFAVRVGNWKLAVCPGSGCVGHYGNVPASPTAWAIASSAFGRQATRSELTAAPFVQLFDLAKDPGESCNLAAEQPDRVNRMIEVLDQQIASGRSTPGSSLQNDGNVDYLRGVPGFVLAK
ncbi:MAG: arylsulfatase [Planctomycetota bacterium]|nr:arylsulfatase [Planctomycetota bacterium]MDA1163649.1 arylsulfatase [Planctomycetota bacterium]